LPVETNISTFSTVRQTERLFTSRGGQNLLQ
jgi:hypothetical protein